MATYKVQDALETSNVASIEIRDGLANAVTGHLTIGNSYASVPEGATYKGSVALGYVPAPVVSLGGKVENARHGTVAINPDLSFIYTPTPGFVGQDFFTYYLLGTDCQSNYAEVVFDVEPALMNVDSENVGDARYGGYYGDFQSPAQEDLTRPGKIVAVDAGDPEGDGIPGFASGFGLNGPAQAGSLNPATSSFH